MLRPLSLPRDLVLEPLLNGRTLFDDGRLVLVVDMRVLVVGRGRLREVLVERRTELGDGAWTFFSLAVARDDGVADDFERVEAGDVGGFGSVLAVFRVQPVLGFLEQCEEFGFFGGLDVRGITVIEFATGVVDVFFEGIFAVLGWGGEYGACMRNKQRVDAPRCLGRACRQRASGLPVP